LTSSSSELEPRESMPELPSSLVSSAGRQEISSAEFDCRKETK
jgi:hypothetical protein